MKTNLLWNKNTSTERVSPQISGLLLTFDRVQCQSSPILLWSPGNGIVLWKKSVIMYSYFVLCTWFFHYRPIMNSKNVFFLKKDTPNFLTLPLHLHFGGWFCQICLEFGFTFWANMFSRGLKMKKSITRSLMW